MFLILTDKKGFRRADFYAGQPPNVWKVPVPQSLRLVHPQHPHEDCDDDCRMALATSAAVIVFTIERYDKEKDMAYYREAYTNQSTL